MDKDLIDIISREFSFFSQEELEQAVEQAREEIKADLGMLLVIWFHMKSDKFNKGNVI